MTNSRHNLRDVYPPTGSAITAKSWLTEAPMRMLMNNLDPEVAERHIAAGDFDFLAMGRKLLADPDLPNKLAGQDPAAVRPCIYCYICVSQIFINQPMVCAVNHNMGREYEGDIIATIREAVELVRLLAEGKLVEKRCVSIFCST